MSNRSAPAQTMDPRPSPLVHDSQQAPRRFEVIQGGEEARSAAEKGRAMLRAAVEERLLQVLKDVHGRLAAFLKNPGRLGVVNLPLVLSESSLTYELWKGPASNPEYRAQMVAMMGVAPNADDASLVGELMAEVHQAFVDFQKGRPGSDARKQYEEVLQGFELANVLPVVPGHDTGPMLAELARLGITPEKDFSRSLLVVPQVVAVGLSPEEGSTSQVVIAGLTVLQLCNLVAHLRNLNPLLSNRQVRQLLVLSATDLKKAIRKSMGQAEVDLVQDLARQLLRLQVVELLFV
ncbi:hypothetical protein [Archangium lansingense]|uniref:Uncharacterized protein n=1 Tax=Archangium lansingense TaxID=2995310 RepID=A0ABT4A9U1_9BACT|nr:hypothetical protein [Archangium lansinium]MCY1078428.1 hypothetical protein [Archangium lansinium]